MDSVSVTPAAVAPRVDAPTSRPVTSEGDGASVKPFGEELERELAASGAERPDESASAESGTAEDKTANAELLQGTPGAGALRGEPDTSVSDPAGAVQPLTAADIAALAVTSEVVPLPTHALLSTPTPARVEANSTELSESTVESPTLAAGDTPARAPRARNLNALEDGRPQAERSEPGSPALDAALVALPFDGGAPRETPAVLPHNALTLDSLASSAFGSRWAGAPAAAVDTSASAPVTTARIETPFGESGWSDAFQQKIVWLVDRQQQSAEISMNPPHLGPVEVVLSLADDGTHVAFSSPHAAVREAIEASLLDLKNALADKGLALGGALVSADSGSAREQLAQETRPGSRGASSGAAGAAAPVVQPARVAHRGLIDLFA